MKTELVTVTPEMAMQWLEQFKLEGQRQIRKPVVARYAQMMLTGEWRPGTQIALSANGDGHTYLINGQHRLSAVIESGTSQVFAVLTRDENIEQARMSYQYDDLQSRRSVYDAVRVSGLSDKTGISDVDIRVLASAVICIATKFVTTGTVNPSKRKELILEWEETFKNYRLLLSRVGITRNRADRFTIVSNRTPIVASAIYTLRYQREIAENFWQTVFAPENISSKSPEVKLREFLIAYRDKSGGQQSRRMQINAIARTWAAAYMGYEIKQIKFNSSLPSPLFIGCPEVGA
jgi:hypothetical protein